MVGAVVDYGSGRAGGVRRFCARAVVSLDPVRNACPALCDRVGVRPVDSLVNLRPRTPVVLPFEGVAGKVAIFIRGGSPSHGQAFAAANAGRNVDTCRGRGGAVPNDGVCTVRICGIRYQD